MKKDPVCGMMVDESKAAAKTVYKDVDIFFCAKRCKELFEQNPEKYLKKK